MPIQFENEYVRYVIGEDARNLHFIDKATGTDCVVRQPASVCAQDVEEYVPWIDPTSSS